MSVIGVLLQFIPLLLILWLASLADRTWRTRAPWSQPGVEGGPSAGGDGRGQPAMVEAAGQGATAPAAYPAPAAGPASGPIYAAPVAPARQAPDDAGTVFAVLSYGLLILIYLGLLVAGIVLQALVPMLNGPNGAQIQGALRQSGMDPQRFAAALPGVAAGMWIPSVFGLLLLLRPVRRLIARLIPIDPRRTVHAVALSFTMLVLVNLLITVPLLPSLASSLEQQSQQGQVPFGIGAVWTQEIGLLVMALIGTGFLARRSLRQVLDRLGFVAPTWRQVGIGVLAGLLLIPVSLGLQALAGLFHINVNADVERLSNALVGPLTQSAFGIITMGVAAGLGEEAVFRGALQPRFGLVLTTLLFALLHGQDGLSLATLVVLIIGFGLAFVRQRTNTTTSLITHAVYNSTLGLLAFLQIMK